MTPQEQDLINQLLQRLKQQAGSQPKDAEADLLIRRAAQENPDATYLLVQTVLIQDMALNNVQGRITELERQLAEAKAAPKQPTSFLGNLLGGGSPARPAAPAPQAGPWGQPQPPQQQPSGPWGGAPQQGYPQGGAYPPGGYPQGGYPPPGYGAQVQPSATSGFLRSAAATAAGVAGGALLFQGIQSMFGHGGMGGMGGMGGGWNNASMTQQPSLTENTEIVNNNYYYSSDQGSVHDANPTREANWSGADNSGYQQVADDRQDDSSQDFASNDDPGGGGDDYA